MKAEKATVGGLRDRMRTDREKKRKEDVSYASKKFGIPEAEIVWHNSGICYDRIAVTTLEAAMKVHEAVKGDTVNGGMLDGMPLGGISKLKGDSGYVYEVMC